MILGAETVLVVLWAAQEIEQGGAGLAGMEDRLVDQRSAQRQLPPAWIPPGLEVAERAPPPEPVQDPDDLAGTAVFLASSDADMMTGQVLVVDGGQVMLG